MKHVPFSQFAEQVITTTREQVWCAVATVDTEGRPRNRVLHPIWELSGESVVGWICTDRDSLKNKHFERVPFASALYDTDIRRPIELQCRIEWVDDLAAKQRIWDWFKREPEPLGYDPALIWKTVDNPKAGLLKLIPYRITVGELGVDWYVWSSENAP